MGLKRVRSKVTGREYDAFHFESPLDFDGLEKFVGGDAEFRAGKIVVAGPEGYLELDSNGWVVQVNASNKFAAASDAGTMCLFEVIS
jgi:folate-dependent tRNA-U54 methylase TrmFO/GidA